MNNEWSEPKPTDYFPYSEFERLFRETLDLLGLEVVQQSREELDGRNLPYFETKYSVRPKMKGGEVKAISKETGK